MNRIKIILLLVSVLSSLLFTSCTGAKTKYTRYSLDLFDTVTTITGYETDQASFDHISGEILDLLAEYHQLCNIYSSYDGMHNLYTLNKEKNGIRQTMTADHRLIDLLWYAKEMYTVTNGKLNIAMGSVLSLWHDCRTAALNEPWNAALPDMDDLRRAADHTDISDLIIDREKLTVYISDPEMTVDAGAVAKGYAVEMAARMLEDRGISGYVINAGGNVRTVGSKPDGEKWIVGIENPDTESKEPYLYYLALSGEAVVTSGSYQRYYTVNGKDYHHIIDPDTLFPAEGYRSVSVICQNSAEGDALSTALFCMSYEEGLALVENTPDAEAVWIMTDGSRRMSIGFEEYLLP